jgi:excisionase family DNA binding protein
MFLTVTQTAEYLNISESQVRNLLANDETFPKPYCFGTKAFRISKASLEEWIQTRKTNLNSKVKLSSITYKKKIKAAKKVSLRDALANYENTEGLLDGTGSTI